MNRISIIVVILYFFVSCSSANNNVVFDYYYIHESGCTICVNNDTLNNKQIIQICDYVSPFHHPDSSYILGTIEIALNSSGSLYLPLASSKERYVMVNGEVMKTTHDKACLVRLSNLHKKQIGNSFVIASIPICNNVLNYIIPNAKEKSAVSLNNHEINSIQPSNGRRPGHVYGCDFDIPKDIRLLLKRDTLSNLSDYECHSHSRSFVYKGCEFRPGEYFMRDGLSSCTIYGTFFLNPYYPDCVFYDGDDIDKSYDCFLSDSVSVIEITPFSREGLNIYDRKYYVNPPWIRIDFN